MSTFIDLLVFPSHLAGEFTDDEKVCAQVFLSVGLKGRGRGEGEWGIKRGRLSPFAQKTADIPL